MGLEFTFGPIHARTERTLVYVTARAMESNRTGTANQPNILHLKLSSSEAEWSEALH